MWSSLRPFCRFCISTEISVKAVIRGPVNFLTDVTSGRSLEIFHSKAFHRCPCWHSQTTSRHHYTLSWRASWFNPRKSLKPKVLSDEIVPKCSVGSFLSKSLGTQQNIRPKPAKDRTFGPKLRSTRETEFQVILVVSFAENRTQAAEKILIFIWY